MEKLDLESKWHNLTLFENKSGYKALRISSNCLPDLFLACDLEGYRCLLLYLPKNEEFKLNESDKSKLVLSYLPSKSIVFIKLKDFDFIDLFNELIISIYSKIKSIPKSEDASKEFINTFYKWFAFFENTRLSKLSETEIQGLFGELFILNQYLGDANPQVINDLLSSWKGLYDAANDFELDSKNVEVKTRNESKSFVKISSEFQLESESNRGLELIVVTIKLDLINGKSIYDLLLLIVAQVRRNFGDLSILYHAFNQKHLSIESLKEYNNHRFFVQKTELFDATKEGFPKLCRSNINDEIFDLKYNLRITKIAPFLIEEIKF